MGSITLTGVSKSFGSTRVLRGVDLAIADGEFLTLLGPSGCGKSTLLRIIAGLEQHDEGTVEIDGRCIDDVRPAKRNIAMVFQSYALYPYMTARQNIALPLVMREMSRWQRLPLLGAMLPGGISKRREIDRRVMAVAQLLELGRQIDRKPGELSGGQRQRVALGRAIIRDPAAFLMDEPLSNLDAKLRIQMRTEIASLHRRLGTTFLYVTHDQAEAMTMSDRVAVMLDGAILQIGNPHDIYTDPDNLRVAGFIGSPAINVLPCRPRSSRSVECGDTVFTLPGAADLKSGSEVRVGIRPEALSIAEPGAPSIVGTIERCENLGSDIFVRVRVDGLSEPLVARLTPGHLDRLEPGAPIRLTPSPAALLLFGSDGQRIRWRGSANHHLRAVL